MTAREEVTREELLELFNCDLDTGRLFWRVKRMRVSPGAEAGCPILHSGRKWYWIIKVRQKAYRRAALVFCVANGRLPKPMVDHINGDSLDDRASNLREATHQQNMWNRVPRIERELPMGVSRSHGSGKYHANICCDGKHHYLGTFATVSDAEGAYRAKRKELFGEFA